jgi:GNAT superfamily N-acetyltransferase
MNDENVSGSGERSTQQLQRISLRDIANCVKLLPHMKDLSRTVGMSDDHPFVEALLLNCKLFPGGRDAIGADVWWATPFRWEGKCFFAYCGYGEVGNATLFYIDHIYTPERGKGYARKTLRMLCDLADYHGAALALHAEAEADKAMSDDQLQAWYERHGFVFDGRLNDGDRSYRGGIRMPKSSDT